MQYERSYGRSLGNTLYINTDQYCCCNGYINSINLRLFTNWKDNVPLYLFIIAIGWSGLGIAHRYAIQPRRNTTEWQTIKIPSHVLPIFLGNFLAIGMQDSSNTNQIYVVKEIPGIIEKGINKNTTNVFPAGSYDSGVAFGYVVVHNGRRMFY